MSADQKKLHVIKDISDETWLMLKQLSGLPDDARSEIEEVVRFVREKPSLKKPLATELHVTRENFREAIRGLDYALKPLKALIEFGAHFAFHPLDTGPNNQANAIGVKHEVIRLRDMMTEVKSDLEYSKRRLKYVPAGAPKGHLPWAIGWLNEILVDRTGRQLDQKKKAKGGIDLSEFVLQALRAADPSLKIGTIQNLIKRLQSEQAKGTGRRGKTRGPRK